MQTNQKISMGCLLAMVMHYSIQDCIIYMGSEDILIVLIYNC